MSLLPDIDDDGKIVVDEAEESGMDSACSFAYKSLTDSRKDKVDALIHNEKLTMRKALERVGILMCIR